ncbi:L-threonylcarbamoyladenylate synthase [Stagnihabitans tardus]|uniref:Threonylcarbamoyl-AMP synthase n=1 Tax=Stagnihabitans tardus TaxID=2699202 RepID=A0AAE4Y6X3_9RHOB|nr:L-threonylcarbamoyladenylate synthase [Stagnihabitans tardus]NBZ86986.1 threonylcarbamoyl-AMP synthase [Stagnihabitans tardus]
MNATRTLRPDAPGIAEAARLLAEGQLVAFPTETVYGLGADATNDLAVAGIFAAKGRPRFNPLIAHVSSLEMAEEIARFDARALALAREFWPGPLTLVLPTVGRVSPLVTADLPTVALRFPAHPTARALIAALGRPVAAPSANPSGKVSPTRAAHVLAGLSGRIAAVIDDGACAVGVESTILGVFEEITLLRPGGLAVEAIEALVGPLARPKKTTLPNAPGQLESHYAPEAPITLNATTPGAVHIGFGPETRPDMPPGEVTLNLSPRADLTEAAANLFHFLREADRLAQGRPITVAPIPDQGLGRAINDRLARAAAPRP